MADLRLCAICLSNSQASYISLHSTTDFIQFELTFARLRYSLGGDRPSQTTKFTRSKTNEILNAHLEIVSHKKTYGWYFIGVSTIG
jgi:hypothetical protein